MGAITNANRRAKRKERNKMLPCSKCLEKQWKYAFNSGIIIATCGFCGSEVSFESRKLKKQRLVDERIAERIASWSSPAQQFSAGS